MGNFSHRIAIVVVCILTASCLFAQKQKGLLKPASFFKNDTLKGFSYNFDISGNYNNGLGNKNADAVVGVGYQKTLVPKKLSLKVSLTLANKRFKQLSNFNNEPFSQQSLGFYPTSPLNILPEIELAYAHKGLFAQIGVAPQQFLNQTNNLYFSPSAGPMPFASVGYKHKLFTYQYVANYSSMSSLPKPANRFAADKLIATHLLEIPIFKWLSAGFYESVVFLLADTNGTRGFDLAYLNPAVVFRPVEYNNGSADNVLLGAWLESKISPSFTIKGQLLLDEFFLKEVKAQNGWWANKFGGLLALEYHHDFAKYRIESSLNILAVRPYTYSHTSPYQSYTNGNLNIGPILGSNFSQIQLQANLQSTQNAFLVAANLYEKGYSGLNIGQNPLLDNSTRQADYGNSVAQFSDGTTVSVLFRYTQKGIIAKRFNVYTEIQGVTNTQTSDSDYALRLGINTNLSQLFYNY